jgi:hypothetical protein
MAPMGYIEATALGEVMRKSLWLYPAVEIAHLTGIALLVGSIAVLDLRLLGLSRSIPVRRFAAHVLPWSMASFALILPSGLAMFVAHASDFIGNPVFLLKLSLILTAGVNAAVFHVGVYRGAAAWDADQTPPPAARAAAALSLVLWVSVIACGRLLAYT